jgi:hypothetical protein
MLVKSDARSEAGVLPDEKLLSAMGEFNEAMLRAGVMLAGEGLKASSFGSRIRIVSGKSTVGEGPFGETKDLVAGYWFIRAASKAEAIDWARRVPFVDGQIELRPLYELSDFGMDPSAQPEVWREQEEKQRAGIEAAPPARLPGTKRFVILLHADKNTEAGMPANEGLLTAMGALMDEMAKSGALLGGEGLKQTSLGARVEFSGGVPRVVDGPFAESKELVAGLSLVQLKTKQEAVAFARRMLEIHMAGTGINEGTVDVREVFELEDFPVDSAEKPDGWREKERAARERISA